MSNIVHLTVIANEVATGIYHNGILESVSDTSFVPLLKSIQGKTIKSIEYGLTTKNKFHNKLSDTPKNDIVYLII